MSLINKFVLYFYFISILPINRNRNGKMFDISKFDNLKKYEENIYI